MLSCAQTLQGDVVQGVVETREAHPRMSLGRSKEGEGDKSGWMGEKGRGTEDGK